MTLPTPDLDDRRFQDLVDEAKRLIPHYCPEWTNHNLSDPGIALVELFAWMTEMTLYRLNQVPDRLYVKFLELMGVSLFPAVAAGAELTFWLSAVDVEPVLVPAGTEVSTTGGAAESVVFMTDADLRIAPPELTQFLTASANGRYVDRWDDLEYERATITCFTSSPPALDDSFYLGFADSLAGNVVRLDVDGPIQGLGIDPERAPLRWEIWSGQEWVPAQVHSDTTGGLNRAGAVVLLLPLVHAPMTLGERRAWWLRGRLIDPIGDEPAYDASPEIRSLEVVSLGGTVSAHHGRPGPREIVGRSEGEPGQVFTVRSPPVLPRRTGEEVQVRGPDGPETWLEVEDFAASAAQDHHVLWDGSSGEIRFGPIIRYPDGTLRQHGAVPPKGALIEVSAYRQGGGARGNVGAGTLSVLRTTIPFIDRVENLGPADGGVDPETVDNAKLRGPARLRTGNRAVTAADFELLTLEAAPAVARARCLPPAEQGGPIRLLVVPRVDKPPEDVELDDFVVSDELVAQIGAYLDRRRTLGTSVEVGTPFYQGVTVAARVTTVPGRPADLVRQRSLNALYRYVNPMVGGATGKGWAFDTDLGVGGLFQLLDAVDGVDRVEDVLLFEADLRNRRRYGTGKELVRLRPESLFLSFAHRVVVE
ncbi:MAG: putative baseplate assembly protein [Acidimicrobiales bacterium]